MKGANKNGKENSRESEKTRSEETRCEESKEGLLKSRILDPSGKPYSVEDVQVQPMKQGNTKMENAIVKQEAGLPTAPMTGSWGTEGVDSKDIMLPKLRLMQGLSEAVAEGNAAMGDLVNSLTGEKLGDKNTPVEIIPISTYKTWIVSRKSKGSQKFEFEEVIPATRENYREFNDREVPQADGSTLRYDETLNFFVLVAKELEEGAALPYVFSASRTSYKAGKMIISHFTKMSMLKQPPAAKTLKISCHSDKNDLGTYYVIDVTPGRVTTPEELKMAYEWYVTLSKGTHKVDNSDLMGGQTASTSDEEGTAQY